jgi:hypothetical protein
MGENCLGGPVQVSRVNKVARGEGGVGGEMASSETEASPPSRRRPPRMQRRDCPTGQSELSCHTFMITLLGFPEPAGPLKQIRRHHGRPRMSEQCLLHILNNSSPKQSSRTGNPDWASDGMSCTGFIRAGACSKKPRFRLRKPSGMHCRHRVLARTATTCP